MEMSIVLGSTARCHGDCLQYSSVSAVDEFKAEAVLLNPFGSCYRYDGVGALSYKLQTNIEYIRIQMNDEGKKKKKDNKQQQQRKQEVLVAEE